MTWSYICHPVCSIGQQYGACDSMLYSIQYNFKFTSVYGGTNPGQDKPPRPHDKPWTRRTQDRTITSESPRQ